MKPYYEDGWIKIFLGDCRDVLPSLPSVDHVICDPPYSADVHGKQWIAKALTDEAKPRVSTAHSELGFDALTPELQVALVSESVRLARRWSIFFCDLESIGTWRDVIRASGLDYVRSCVWDKIDSAPQFTGDRPAASAEGIVLAHHKGKKQWNGGGRRNVFRHAVNGLNRGGKPHPSTKPQGLMRELIELFTNEGDLILDPCCGSGSTLRAAKDLGRRAIGIDNQERWCEVAAQSMSQDVLWSVMQEELLPT